jgi:hypothetical protein
MDFCEVSYLRFLPPKKKVLIFFKTEVTEALHEDVHMGKWPITGEGFFYKVP